MSLASITLLSFLLLNALVIDAFSNGAISSLSLSLSAKSSPSSLSFVLSLPPQTTTATRGPFSEQHQQRHQYHQHQYHHDRNSMRLYASTSETDIEKLRQKAARLREEIAALEGKSVEQVTQEANDKKEAQQRLLNDRKGDTTASSSSSSTTSTTSKELDFSGRRIDIPQDMDGMIFQAARAVEMAYRDGIARQTVRLALVAEGDSFQELNEWPGGAQQMFREAAKPLTMALLGEINPVKASSSSSSASPSMQQPWLRPKITCQDIWDFDGSALITAEGCEGPQTDVQALVFANTDVKYIRDIATIDAAMGDRLFVLVNPFWRNVESWGFNILAPGAKAKAQSTIFDKGFDETYVYLRFSVRGENCAAIKCYPYDWQIFAYREDDSGWERPIRLGTSKTEPKSDQITALLNARPEFKLTRAMRQLTKY